MRPTRPADARRARHEATGEWPQPSLSTLLAARARTDPHRPYLIEGLREGGRTFTFRDVARRADRVATALLRLGVGAGDVVSWQLPNWMECAALAAAIDRLGAVSNPCGSRRGAQRRSSRARHSGGDRGTGARTRRHRARRAGARAARARVA